MWQSRLRGNRQMLMASFAYVLLCSGCSQSAGTNGGRGVSPRQEPRDPLPAFASIRYVVLDDDRLTNKDLQDLELIPRLTAVVLDSPMDDDSVDALAKLRRHPQTLERLDLIGPQFTNEALKSMATFKRLRSLDLDCTSIDDAGVAAIASMGLNLEQLNLYGCGGVTDKSIPHLEDLEHLTGLNIQETGISRGGTLRLMEALPNAWIGNSYGLPNAQPKPAPFRVSP